MAPSLGLSTTAGRAGLKGRTVRGGAGWAGEVGGGEVGRVSGTCTGSLDGCRMGLAGGVQGEGMESGALERGGTARELLCRQC